MFLNLLQLLTIKNYTYLTVFIKIIKLGMTTIVFKDARGFNNFINKNLVNFLLKNF